MATQISAAGGTKRKAPVKNAAVAAAGSSEESSRLQLARAISAMTASAEQFTHAVEEYKTFTATSISDVDQRIAAAQLEYNDRERDFETKYKKRKVDLDLEFQENARKAALEILAKTSEVPIEQDELNLLRKKTAEAEAELKAAVNAATAKVYAELEKRLKEVAKEKELEHKANIADINAQNQQLAKQVDSLRQTIAEQREEIAAQRKLTQSVAEASKQGAISQTFGK